MGILSNLFKHEETAITTNNVAPSSTPVASTGILNLNKGDVLDLTKSNPNLTKVHAAAGWDVAAHGKDYDLDLCAYLLNSKGDVVHTVYYADKDYDGIFLDKDNLTGEGDGDDENIHVVLDKLPVKITRIIFGVVIYEAKHRGQKFDKVKNAYVRLCDEADHDKEICRYQITENGGDNTAIEVASLNKDSNNHWSFQAIGTYSKDSISSLGKKVGK